MWKLSRRSISNMKRNFFKGSRKDKIPMVPEIIQVLEDNSNYTKANIEKLIQYYKHVSEIKYSKFDAPNEIYGPITGSFKKMTLLLKDMDLNQTLQLMKFYSRMSIIKSEFTYNISEVILERHAESIRLSDLSELLQLLIKIDCKNHLLWDKIEEIIMESEANLDLSEALRILYYFVVVNQGTKNLYEKLINIITAKESDLTHQNMYFLCQAHIILGKASSDLLSLISSKALKYKTKLDRRSLFAIFKFLLIFKANPSVLDEIGRELLTKLDVGYFDDIASLLETCGEIETQIIEIKREFFLKIEHFLAENISSLLEWKKKKNKHASLICMLWGLCRVKVLSKLALWEAVMKGITENKSENATVQLYKEEIEKFYKSFTNK